MGTDYSIKKSIILFDGVCNLCNASVQFVIKRDKKKQFLFASLQSDFAEENLPKKYISSNALQSIVLKDGDHIKTKSTAALTIARRLSGLWPMLYLFIIVPKFLRDWVYDIVARNRYKWFGKKDQCMIPSPELKDRFFD
ncbi:thiol-disulfide oxidoreductase DCC family protein [Ekhidna sp.]|uniref:thiol-disulfide oxidoreductase DCC family protein n=1 Tax=Ekhidna sp. TaxID=2608089 RepID=UPI003C7BF51E